MGFRFFLHWQLRKPLATFLLIRPCLQILWILQFLQLLLINEDISDLCHLLLSEAAYVEFHSFSNSKLNVPTGDSKDTWSYKWGSDYSVSKAYAAFPFLLPSAGY
jgi:hypothetical protein